MKLISDYFIVNCKVALYLQNPMLIGKSIQNNEYFCIGWTKTVSDVLMLAKLWQTPLRR